MIDFVAEEIRRLSQEEGLHDHEIAERLGISRVTVNRARKAYGIPRANLANRKDKTYECRRCGREITIARKERRQKYCDECKGVVEEEARARKREQYHAKKKTAGE